jgi:hypothetical protein
MAPAIWPLEVLVMTSLRSKFLAILFAFVALFALAGPASAAKSKHHRRKGTHGSSHPKAHHAKKPRKHAS